MILGKSYTKDLTPVVGFSQQLVSIGQKEAHFDSLMRTVE
jgi:hypothetical protein